VTRRDRWGRYLVVPPGGGKPLGYTRVTTIAKTLDDGSGLLDWKATASVVGTMRRQGIRASWEQLINEHPDPWYGSPESKKRCKELVKEAAEAGGSGDRAQLGTALHAMVETLNKGGTPLVSQDSTQRDLDAYTAAITAAGIHIDPNYCERTVVLDELQVAGTADMLVVKVPDVGTVVGDLKTGASLDFGWNAIAVQLAAYASADAVYAQGETPDDDQRLAMPDVRNDVGLVIHLPAGEARCTLWLVDLAAGRQALEQSMWVRQWRKRKDLAKPYVGAPVAPAAPSVVVEDDFDAPKVTPLPTPETPKEQKDELRSAPDEGGDVDPAALAALKAAFDALTDDERTLYQGFVQQARRAGVSWLMQEKQSLRRFEIIRAMLRLCREGVDAEVVRALAAAAMGSDAPLFPSVTVGHAVGALDASEAATFARLADAFLDKELPARFDEHGVLRFQAA